MNYHLLSIRNMHLTAVCFQKIAMPIRAANLPSINAMAIAYVNEDKFTATRE
jgi:hypothetical protein